MESQNRTEETSTSPLLNSYTVRSDIAALMVANVYRCWDMYLTLAAEPLSLYMQISDGAHRALEA